MNKIFLGVIVMTALSLNPRTAYSNPQDEAAIKTIVESVAMLADRGNFEALERLYAPEVEMDYTSLAGGEVEIKSPRTIMNEWAAVLPGFDRTRHEIRNIQVMVEGSTATATADVTADHYIDDLYWQVKGDYVYRLQKDEEVWQITSHQFNLTEESGTRDVFSPASEKAAANPSSYIVRQNTAQAVRSFLTALETKDMISFADMLAEDMVQDMPYSPQGFPKKVNGKESILELYANWLQTSGRTDFTSNLVFYPMVDPKMVFVEFKGDVEIIPTGRQYKQHYGGLFHVEDGKIKLYREYFDPEPFVYAFDLKQ